MKNIGSVLISMATIVLGGCSAALVPYTSDPIQKVAYAKTLEDQGRTIPEARLLREVHEISPTDVPGYLLRGESHFLYLRLIDGKSIGREGKFTELVESNSQDAATHYELALKDYLTAKTMVVSGSESVSSFAGGKNFALSNIAWRMAQLYFRKGELQLACNSMDDVLRAVKDTPDEKISYNRKKYSSFSEYIADNKKWMSCP